MEFGMQSVCTVNPGRSLAEEFIGLNLFIGQSLAQVFHAKESVLESRNLQRTHDCSNTWFFWKCMKLQFVDNT